MKKNNYVKPLSKVVKVEIETQLLENSKTGLPEVGDGGGAWGGNTGGAKSGWFDDDEKE